MTKAYIYVFEVLEAWEKQDKYGGTCSCSGQQVDEVNFAESGATTFCARLIVNSE